VGDRVTHDDLPSTKSAGYEERSGSGALAEFRREERLAVG
jgi:hypothetical protein